MESRRDRDLSFSAISSFPNGVGGTCIVWLSGALAVACLVVGVVHLLRLVVLRRDVAGEASHAAMGLGMAAMFAPHGNPVPAPVWTAVFALCATWFGVLALRGGPGSGPFGNDALHHVLGSGAMLFMLAVHSGRASGSGGEHGGHLATHGSGGAGALGLASVVAIGLAGYFVWHALRCADRCRPFSAAPRASARGGSGVVGGNVRSPNLIHAQAGRPVFSLRTPQAAAASHLLMAAVMAVMLLGMI